jgi:4-hydroxy-4-methyl-2-oxoglutarate aldolase
MDPIASLRDLSVSVVADTLDRLGHRNQVMTHQIRPRTDETVFMGAAHPIEAHPTDRIPENPYEHEIAAVDSVSEGGIIVISTQGQLEVSVWGELLATRAIARGCTGAVVDGGIRDLHGLRDLGIPTFAASVSANDSRGRLEVVNHGQQVTCGGVRLEAGDIIKGDLDGVVVVPRGLVAETVEAATDKRAMEVRSMEALRAGATAADAYAEYGVL